MIKFRGRQYRPVLRVASKETFYHGTATGTGDEVLRLILKQGLVPDPKTRVWGGDDHDPDDYAYWQTREKESLGGVYFSTDPGRTSVYMQEAASKLGGDEVLVIAQLETRTPTMTLDEEALFGYYRAAVARFIEHQHQGNIVRPDAESLPRYLSSIDIDWQEAARWFIDDQLVNGSLQQWPNIPQQRVDAVVPLLGEALRWQAEFLMASHYAGRDDYSAQDYIGYGTQDPDEALQRYRSLTEQVLRKFRELTEVPKSSQYYDAGHEVRMLEPVTYRGANKILAVLRIRDTYDSPEPYYRVVDVVYSVGSGARVPLHRALEKFKQAWSPNMLWRNQDGSALYDVPKTKQRLSSYYRQYEPGSLQHRRTTDTTPVGNVILFADEEDRNRHYGQHVWTLMTELPSVPDYVVEFAADYYEVDLEEAEELVDPPNIVDTAAAWDDPEFVYDVWAAFEDPGYRTYDGAVVLDREAVEMQYRYDEED